MKLTIEKMIYGGDGLARSPEGKAAFVPLVLPGEEVEANVLEAKKGYIRALPLEVLKASEQRIAPACRYFSRCGGCHYQHTDYQTQLGFKLAILRETFKRTAKFEWADEITTHCAEPWGYRNRARLKVRNTPDFALGYHRLASHELLPVESCPISSPAINRVMGHLWDMGRAGHIPPGIREIEVFAGHDDADLLLEVYGVEHGPDLKEFFSALQATMPEVKGVAVFAPEAGPTPGPPKILGQSFLAYRAGPESFRVSAGSFFQVNRFLVEELARGVAAGVSGKLALDLYAGVGLFARHLAQNFEQVLAVESALPSAQDLKANALKNITPVQATTEEFLERNRKPGKLRPDFVVVDPPRAGLGEKTAGMLATLQAPQIVYVSCDPTTLARDLVTFLKSGYRVQEVRLFDLFPQTFHIESVVRLGR
ncbi:MAG TPA: 23S rRNA (uracil(1939)-C(5))-methyltransferase RlmD [Candidatus Saccharimonadales bacterium]|jgi:23S rRNA (uracil1939-C5)-methyltransferase|nr:23S rRNA (uracil(1939)-C(5))-methyltransferase RlmD [Candidatus Saccharimonadales bacterium]